VGHGNRSLLILRVILNRIYWLTQDKNQLISQRRILVIIRYYTLLPFGVIPTHTCTGEEDRNLTTLYHTQIKQHADKAAHSRGNHKKILVCRILFVFLLNVIFSLAYKSHTPHHPHNWPNPKNKGVDFRPVDHPTHLIARDGWNQTEPPTSPDSPSTCTLYAC
jgi:hypothetical protein